MSIWIHCSSSLIRSQRKNATSLNHILNLLNNRNGIEKKISSLPGRGGHFLVAQSQVSGASPTQGWTGTCRHLLLAGLGSCRAGVCGPKTASSAEGQQERGSPGTWASSVLTSAKGNFPPDWQCFGREMDGRVPHACPVWLLERCLPSPGLVSSPALKILL